VFLGKDNTGKIVAVVFDPHPEEVLGIRSPRSKSKEACKVIKQEDVQKKLEEITEKLLEFLRDEFTT